jgi:hypothetical protein
MQSIDSKKVKTGPTGFGTERYSFSDIDGLLMRRLNPTRILKWASCLVSVRLASPSPEYEY